MEQTTPSELTTEELIQTIMKLSDAIKAIISTKLFQANDSRRAWVNRYYGGKTGLYNEIFQTLVLKLMMNIQFINPAEIKKAIFTELKGQIQLHIYYPRHEICESEFGIDFSIFNVMVIDEEYEEFEDSRPKVSLDIETAPITENERKILKYSFFKDMDYDAICKKLKMKRATVMHFKNTAIDKLRADYYLKYACQ